MFVEAAHKEQLKGKPRLSECRVVGIIKFHHKPLTEVRHVPVEDGIRIVGKLRGGVVDGCKWSTCQKRSLACTALLADAKVPYRYLCSSTSCWIWWWRPLSTCVLFHTHWSPPRWRCCPSLCRTGHSFWELHVPLPRKTPGSNLTRWTTHLPWIFSSAATLVRYGTKPLLPTSEYFGKLQTLHWLLSDTHTLFSHKPNELALSQNISRSTKLCKECTKTY